MILESKLTGLRIWVKPHTAFHKGVWIFIRYEKREKQHTVCFV